MRKSLTNYNAHTHTHTHIHTIRSALSPVHPSVTFCVYKTKNIKGKLKVGKLFFMKEYSKTFSSFFYVIGFEVIPEHLITHSIKPHLSMAPKSLVCKGLLTLETSRSHSDPPHSAGLLWKSDQPVEDTCT